MSAIKEKGFPWREVCYYVYQQVSLFWVTFLSKSCAALWSYRCYCHTHLQQCDSCVCLWKSDVQHRAVIGDLMNISPLEMFSSSKRFRVNVLPSVKAQLRCFIRRFGAQTRCRLLAFVQWPLTSGVSCMTQIWLFGFDPVCFCQLLNGCRDDSATVWETSKYDDFMFKCGD